MPGRLGIALISKLAWGGWTGAEPRDTDMDDLTEREAARECANRAVLEVLEGARMVEAYESAAGVECIGEAIGISSSLLWSKIV